MKNLKITTNILQSLLFQKNRIYSDNTKEVSKPILFY